MKNVFSSRFGVLTLVMSLILGATLFIIGAFWPSEDSVHTFDCTLKQNATWEHSMYKVTTEEVARRKATKATYPNYTLHWEVCNHNGRCY